LQLVIGIFTGTVDKIKTIGGGLQLNKELEQNIVSLIVCGFVCACVLDIPYWREREEGRVGERVVDKLVGFLCSAENAH